MKKLQIIHYSFTYLFLIGFVFYSVSGNATTYFVSSTGNDANPGTSEDLPWLSLSKVNNFFKLYPGDQVLFKRGDEWNGTVTIRASGTAGSPIIYGAYGTGDKPKIYGSEKITGWTLHSGNIYKARISSPINQLFLEDVRITLARYPNSYDWDFTVSTVNSTTQFTADKLDVNINYTGATWVGRTREWAISKLTVTESSSKTLTLNEAPAYDLSVGEGFFLCNKLEFLDSPGEWYYDTTINTVYLWTPNGDSPANYVVRGSTIRNIISLETKSYITIQNLNLLQSTHNGIYASKCSNLLINNNEISDTDDIGICVLSSTYNDIIIQDNYVTRINHEGIYSYGNNAIVSGNIITDIALFKNLGKSGLNSLQPNAGRGIMISGDNCTISYNRIHNIGFNGIRFYGINNIVEYNYINKACVTVDDGAGIYTYNTDIALPGSAGSIIRYNIVSNVIGNLNGRKKDKMRGLGIYLDFNNHDVLIENNTVFNTSDAGISMLGNGDGMVVKNNTIMSSSIGIDIQRTAGGTKTITNNLIYSLKLDYLGQIQKLFNIRYEPVCNINSNTYINHYNSSEIFGYETVKMDFNAWKAITGQDANSTFIETPLAKGESEELFYNDTKKTKTFNLGNTVFRDIYGKVLKDTFSLQPFTSKILIGKNFQKINQSPVILDQSFHIVSPKITNSYIGQVLANDPDTGQIINYNFVRGNGTELFTIDSVSGEIHAKTDLQTSKDLSIEMLVKVRDNAANFLSDSAKIIVNIKGKDTTPPIITTFSIPSESKSLTIPINSFTATDDVAVAGYLLTETSNLPRLEDSSWSTAPPMVFTLSNAEISALHAWVKDSAGNISASILTPVKIVTVDMSPTFSEYLYEEAEGLIVFDSKGNNNGTVTNEIIRGAGVIGRGIKFTGNGFINLGQSFGQNVENGISLSTWIKPNLNSREDQGLIIHGGPNGNIFALYVNSLSKSIVFETNGTGNSLFTVDNVSQLWDGNWHHLLVVYNGFEKKIYLNNVVLARISATGKIDNGWGYSLLIGAGKYENSPGLLYDGMIDETRIYNYALNSDEIRELYETVNRKQNSVVTQINKEPDFEENIAVYPNPARNIINIRFSNLSGNIAEITLIDVTGKHFYNSITQSNIEIVNIENLPAGVYFIKTSIKNQSKTKKLLII